MRREKTRTEYSARNTTVSVLSRITAILMGFAVRVVFTHTLNEAYVGVNGLFTDVIHVLSLSELGIETAITYALYGPIARGDEERQKSLMRLYQRFYQMVAGVVLALGLMLLPFLGILTRNQEMEHLALIYLMYLVNSALSYLWIYKRTLIDAHQQIYIGVLYHTIFLLIQDMAQIWVLLFTHNFILFLSISLVCTLMKNISISKKADRLYPFLRDQDAEPLPEKEKQEIFHNIRAMMMHKLGNVMVNNTDNLLLSSFIGLASAGIYSNYYLIIGSVRQVLNQIFQGITASVGNLGVTAKKERIREVFETAFFIDQWIFGLAAICIYELIHSFVEVSFGSQYVFSRSMELILCLNFYITGMRQATLVFRDSLGLFWFDRYKSILEAALNLVISIVLALRFGAAGIFGGTLISMLLTSVWIEPFVLYRYLGEPLRKYFIKYLTYTGVGGLTALSVHRLCMGQSFVRKGIICMVITNLTWLLCYGWTREFRNICKRIYGMFLTRRKIP